MAKDAISALEELSHAMGWEVLSKYDRTFPPGYSSFVTGGWQNRAMTILSLSMRASEYMAGQMRQGSL